MQWSTSGKTFTREHAVSYPALRTLTQYRHIIIDAFLCPWGESPYIFSNLNPLADTPVNPDNGHFFLAQSTSLIRTHHYKLSAVTDLAFLNAK